MTDSFTRRGQQYRVIGPDSYANSRTRLQSNCAECGKSFQLSATAGAMRAGHLNRRCDRHKRPGVPVNPRAVTAVTPRIRQDDPARELAEVQAAKQALTQRARALRRQIRQIAKQRKTQ